MRSTAAPTPIASLPKHAHTMAEDEKTRRVRVSVAMTMKTQRGWGGGRGTSVHMATWLPGLIVFARFLGFEARPVIW